MFLHKPIYILRNNQLESNNSPFLNFFIKIIISLHFCTAMTFTFKNVNVPRTGTDVGVSLEYIPKSLMREVVLRMCMVPTSDCAQAQYSLWGGIIVSYTFVLLRIFDDFLLDF